MNSLMKAQIALQTFDPRGSTCPICKRDFRKGCNHSITQAINRLEQNLFNERLKQSKTKI